jgi:hypothetical protein
VGLLERLVFLGVNPGQVCHGFQALEYFVSDPERRILVDNDGFSRARLVPGETTCDCEQRFNSKSYQQQFPHVTFRKRTTHCKLSGASLGPTTAEWKVLSSSASLVLFCAVEIPLSFRTDAVRPRIRGRSCGRPFVACGVRRKKRTEQSIHNLNTRYEHISATGGMIRGIETSNQHRPISSEVDRHLLPHLRFCTSKYNLKFPLSPLVTPRSTYRQTLIQLRRSF